MSSYCVTQTIPNIDFVSAMVICPEAVAPSDFVDLVFVPLQLIVEQVQLHTCGENNGNQKENQA